MLMSVSLHVTLTLFSIIPEYMILAVIFKVALVPLAISPMTQVYLSIYLPGPSTLIISRQSLKGSQTYTLVALHGPSFQTVIVNSIMSVTLTSVVLTLTVFWILKSTIGLAVMLGIESLLFDLFVSFSKLFTLTALVMFPSAITLAIISS